MGDPPPRHDPLRAPTPYVPSSRPPAEPPVIDGRSSAGQAPWYLPTGAPPPGLTADGFRLGDLDVRAATVVGPGHRCEPEAVARQDAYALRRTHEGGHLVMAVADGVSSCHRSDLGARVAANAAVRVMVEHLDRGVPPDQVDLLELFRRAAGEMAGIAQHRNLPEKDLCAILALAVVPTTARPEEPRRAWTAQIGDLSVWWLRSRLLTQITGPGKGGLDKNMLDEVLPFHPDAVAVKSFDVYPHDRLVLMSDGLSETLVNVAGGREFFVERWSGSPPHPAAFLLDLCYDAPGQTDDRTAVVAWVGADATATGRDRR